jgi:regulation of enolase protein 1 (concanavalin A-like superfamily)
MLGVAAAKRSRGAMMNAVNTVSWTAGRWTNAPVVVTKDGTDLLVQAVEGSDAWRTTAYGFVHSTEHALLAPFEAGAAIEVMFTAAFAEQFDQAGVFVRATDKVWVKAGLEYADGVLGAGAVVTNGTSDWSVGAVPEWLGKRVTIRVSRFNDALVVRARAVGEPFRLLRVAPFPVDAPLEAGPCACAPTRSGLTVRFHSWRTAPQDVDLH